MMKISLIISTYNRPSALKLCLESVKRQNRLPDEVIIGDDGSGDETAALIREFQKDFPVPLLHVWQEDKGFRVGKIRNKCIAKAKYDYIVQVDGDMVLHSSFITDHLSCARRGYYKRGQVNITRMETERLCNREYTPLSFTWGLTRRKMRFTVYFGQVLGSVS
ncbi:MAG: glycosyltransferase [Butyricimonas faecihominis]